MLSAVLALRVRCAVDDRGERDQREGEGQCRAHAKSSADEISRPESLQ